MIALNGPRPALTIFVPHASALLTDNKANGDGLIAFELVSRLAARGHRLHVAAPAIDVRSATPPNLMLYEVGVRRPASMLGRMTYMLKVRNLYERIRRREQIDLAHQLNPVFTGISLALGGTRPPRVLGCFVSDWPSEVKPKWSAGLSLRRRIAALQQHDAAALLIATPAARSRVIEADLNAAKIVTLPYGIDASRYAVTRTAPTPPSVLFLGRLERCKGIFSLIDAFRLVHAAFPQAVLNIAGSGPEWHAVIAAVETAGLSDAVRFLGTVPREDVPRVMAESTVFCLPSHGEPFGMVLLEAMASAKPIVATDLGGPSHIVSPLGGRKVPPGSPAALADALVEILRSPSLADSMGLHNRRLAEERYSWDNLILQLESVYYDVLSRFA
jgi:glycosyltransferase involved in cell wall biosynthesis